MFKGLTLRTTDSPDWFEVSHDEIPWPIKIRVGQADDGRLVCVGLEIDGYAGGASGEINARALHRISLGQLLSRVAEHAERGAPAAGALKAAASAGPVRPNPGPGGYSKEHFERVAVAYRVQMQRNPQAPVIALAKQFKVSEATARRWLRRARDLGFLGESTPGRAGEKISGDRRNQ